MHVVRQVPMRYAAGVDPSLDRPGHIRAGSGLAWVGDRLAVVQDDANFIALVDPTTGLADSIVLPAGVDGMRQFDAARGNKKRKFDLEALVHIDGSDGSVLLAVGSGSSKRREHMIVVARPGDRDATVQMTAVPRLYEALRNATDFSGSDMNIEGAVLMGDVLRLFGRGNGESSRHGVPIDATCDLSWQSLRRHLAQPDATDPPLPQRLRQYALGQVNDIRLTFTDATLAWGADFDNPVLFYTAAAEASPDSRRDGEVAGSAVGCIGTRGADEIVRYAVLRDGHGAPLPFKVEGVACGRAANRQLFVVLDGDDPEAPSMLCELRLDGPWLEFGVAT